MATLTTPTEETSTQSQEMALTLSREEFRVDWIGLKALGLSRTRKAQAIFHKYGPNINRFFDSIPSTELECKADWMHAIAATAVDDLIKTSRLYSLSAEAFEEFEGIWLDDLRKYIAYQNWLCVQFDEHSESTRFECYSGACDELRDYLAAENKPHGPRGAVEYLRQTYLTGADRETRRNNLALRKEHRLLESGMSGAFETARKFVDDFYSSIEDAITLNDPAAIAKVLKAVQSGGSQPGWPSIVNGFEALLLLLFLDGSIVEALWNDPAYGIVRSETL